MTSFLLILPVVFHLLEPVALDFFTFQKLGSEDEVLPRPFSHFPCTGFLRKLQNSIFQCKAMASTIFRVLLISLAEVDEILASEITPLLFFFPVGWHLNLFFVDET